MAALLMTTVVASSSATAFSALSEREKGCPAAVDLSGASRSYFGVDAVVGSSSVSGPSTPRSVRSRRVNSYESNSSSSNSVRSSSVSGSSTPRGVRSRSVNSYESSSSSSNSGLRKDSGRTGYAALSSKLTNDVNQLSSSMARLSKRPAEYYSTMVTDVIENVEFENPTLSETKHARQNTPTKHTKHEVQFPDVARLPRVNTTRLDYGEPTKKISVKDYMERAPAFVNQSDTGPPRWFCPTDTAGFPPDAPILLFLPGMDSTGLGLLLHERNLARKAVPLRQDISSIKEDIFRTPIDYSRCRFFIFQFAIVHLSKGLEKIVPFEGQEHQEISPRGRAGGVAHLLGEGFLARAENEAWIFWRAGLIEVVEERVREEYDRKPSPIYVMAESFGGCLALSVAARNPDLDIVLVIANPATSFEDSPLQPLIPLLQLLPDEIFRFTPYLLSFTMGNPVRMASKSVENDLPPWERLPKVAEAMRDLLPTLSVLAEIMPRDLMTWKVKLLSDGSRYANARLRYVKSDILLLVSGDDKMIPSAREARRLKSILPQIKARYFPESGHTLLLEDGLDVATLIKQTQMLRHRKYKKFDAVKDFRFPSGEEIAKARGGSTKIVHQLFSPIFLSSEKGRIREGLPNLPMGRPLLFVSNHTLIGFDLGLVVEEFLEKRDVLLRGLAHPLLSVEPKGVEESSPTEVFKLFGTVPVSGNNLYKLLQRGEAALLYPGGVREALKRKGEMYKLFWSESAEFVRTAIRHKATIIPFASVGGDDIIEILLDSNDLLSLPLLNDYLKQNASQVPAGRTTGTGEVTRETFVTPLGYLKSPPRFYFMFKQPISTEGMLDSINDRAVTDKLYRKVKMDVESGLEYLLQKRKEDPYKDFLPRVVYEAAQKRQAPSFDI